MALNLTKQIYNEISENKIENESIINELYSNFNNFTMAEKQSAIEIIYNLKIINDEYNKYIVIYNATIQDERRNEEYITIYNDTFQSIAAKMTGDPNNWKAIMKYNNITDLYLEPGTVILIPLNIL